MQPPSRYSLVMLLAFALAACSRDEPPRPALAPALPAARLAVSLDDDASMILPDLMDLVVDPAAGVLFAAAGQNAWNDLEPRSDEAWQAVGDAAAQLARTGDTLAEAALSHGRPDWLQWAAALREGAAAGSAAARRHDPRSLFAAGAQVRASCQGCHARYTSQTSESLALRAPSPGVSRP